MSLNLKLAVSKGIAAISLVKRGFLKAWGLTIMSVAIPSRHDVAELALGTSQKPIDRGQDFETEDILTRDFYSSAVVATYPAQTVIAPEEGRGKRTKLYELTYKTEHGIGFSKRRVGDTVKRLLGSGGGDEASLAALGQLTNAIWEKLRAQVTIQAHA